MQITRQSEYAIKTLLELAQNPNAEVVSTRIISENQGIPEVFLKKTVQLLARAGLVSTQRGTQGGVKLAKVADQITIADIIVAIEGPIAFNICLAQENNCPNKGACSVYPVLARAQESFIKELSKETLVDLIKK